MTVVDDEHPPTYEEAIGKIITDDITAQLMQVMVFNANLRPKKICGFPVSRPYLAFGRQNPDPKLFYWITLVSVST
jgi:hypothetical protein